MSHILRVAEEGKPDILITEIGGTVGDIESQPFLEAVRRMKRTVGAENYLSIHTTLVPFLGAAGEDVYKRQPVLSAMFIRPTGNLLKGTPAISCGKP